MYREMGRMKKRGRRKKAMRFNPDRFNTQKETQYPLYRRLGGSQSGMVQKISPTPILIPRPSSPHPVAIPTMLFWPTKH